MFIDLSILILIRAQAHGSNAEAEKIQICALWATTNALATDMPSQRHGNGHPNVVPYRVFDAEDQPFVVAVGNDGQFGRLARDVIGQPQLADDPRFATNEARSCNRDLLNASLADLFRQRTAETWLTALRKANIPGGRINDVTDALATKQAEER